MWGFFIIQIIAMDLQDLKDAIDAKWCELSVKEDPTGIESELLKYLNHLRFLDVEGEVMTQQQMVDAMLIINDVHPRRLNKKALKPEQKKAIAYACQNLRYLGTGGISHYLGISERQVLNAQKIRS